MSLNLWFPHGNGRASKILIAANYAGLQVEHKDIGYENLKTPEHVARHPFGKVPVLETPEGPIFESFSILRYIARKSNSLFGKNAWQQAQIENWLNLTLSELDPFLSAYVMAIAGHELVTKEKFAQITKVLKDWAKSFEEYIKGKTHIVDNQLSIADIAVASYYHWLFRLLFDDKTRGQLAGTVQWYESISSTPHFQSVLGKTWYAHKEYTPAFFTEEEEKKVEKPKAEKAEKAEKTEKGEKQPKAEKKPQPPKQQKKEEKKDKKKKKEDEDEEEEEKPVEKKVNPLDLLPKSTFNLDDFKREISNNPNKNESVKLFWEKFDPEGWSIWKTVYQRYGDEGTVGYLTSNLKNGFLRNLDHFRKYSFAGFGVYGNEGNYDIKGVWLWRGTEIPEQIRDHQSYEYYTITKLDHTKEEDRKLLEEYWVNINEGQIVEGVPVFDAKHFK